MGKSALWSVYIVRCADNSLYTGITTDPARRVKEHNNGGLGAKYTRARRPVNLVYVEIVENRSDATKREHQIKNLDLQAKLLLIKQGEESA